MNRREVIKYAALMALSANLPFSSRLALAGPFTPLPIPTLLSPNAKGIINLQLQTGQTQWRPGRPSTTWGINGSLLGPALRLRRGQEIQLRVHNALPEDTTVHWHGMEIPGNADGGPQAVIGVGAEWEAQFQVDQPAATCWFHPHTHGRTGAQVAMGLGGLIVIEESEDSTLPLPNTWGRDDIPIILQDKKLTADNQIDYHLDVMSAAVGWFGDLALAPLGDHDILPALAMGRRWLAIF